MNALLESSHPSIHIRKAKSEEFSQIAPLALLAMEDIIYKFIGENSYPKAIEFLKTLIKEKSNQYSYENCWVVEIEKEIQAVAIVYDGGLLQQLRLPVAETIKTMFGKDFYPEDETQTGEYYIDCIGVHPEQQRKGIGSKIFKFLLEEYSHKQSKTLGLLVDLDNPDAKKLYLKLGFRSVGQKTLAGKLLEHLQY